MTRMSLAGTIVVTCGHDEGYDAFRFYAKALTNYE